MVEVKIQRRSPRFARVLACPTMHALNPGYARWVRLELRVQARSNDRDRAAVAVVRRVGNELIIQGHAPGKDGEAVVGLDDLLAAGVRKHSVADQDAEASGVEVGLMHA